jgi:hypothetical protein
MRRNDLVIGIFQLRLSDERLTAPGDEIDIYQRPVQVFGAGHQRQLSMGVTSREEALTKLLDRYS